MHMKNLLRTLLFSCFVLAPSLAFSQMPMGGMGMPMGNGGMPSPEELQQIEAETAHYNHRQGTAGRR